MSNRGSTWSPLAHIRKPSIELSSQSETDDDVHDDPSYYDDEGKINGIMGTPQQPRWREYLPRVSFHWRINNLRHLGMLALLTFTVSLLLFEAHREAIGLVRGEAIDVGAQNHPSTPELDTGRPKVPGQCTTWPVVGSKDNYKSGPHKSNLALQSFAPPGGWKKPDGIAVKALIFYGRKRTVDFLDCYLQQNLAVNGGYLDEVWFMVHTKTDEDLVYLNELIERRRPQYKVVVPGDCEGFNFACMWNPVVEDDTIFIKIDDDIVSSNPFGFHHLREQAQNSLSNSPIHRSSSILIRFLNSYRHE